MGECPMLRSAVTGASAAFLLIALCLIAHENAGAQTQTQGLTATSPGPPHGAGSPDKAASAKAKRADCMSKGKSQGLKGRDLTKFVKDCVNKST
jgi:hypothetical protein